MKAEASNGQGIGIVGTGLGGLAAACTLAARGHRVTVFEKNAWFGGKAAVLEDEGFRFDMGPTILTVPRVLQRIFEEAGRRLEDELELVRLDPQWRCFFEDGSVLDLHEKTGEMSAFLRGYSVERARRSQLRAVHRALQAAARHLRALLLLEVGRGHPRHPRPERLLELLYAAGPLPTQDGSVGCRHHPESHR